MEKVILGIIVLVLLGVAGYFAKPFVFPSSETASTTSEYAFTPKVFPTPAPGQAVYQSLLFKFRLLYPQELSVREVGTGSDTTLVFQNEEKGLGFQVYIIPYAGEQITEAQFKRDVPSGVMLLPEDITIGGVRARSFESSDQLLGETFEVWFIANGFLYEVTTHQSLKEWLSGILSTWQFL